ncbi:Hsp90 cochaperone shq1 [Mortierella antarctica]|nr:Hsp90 cochaperone shq1 [Mortierella antarctica]
MITPVFNVTQDDDYVTIVINAPHIKTQDVDFFVEGQEFKFYLKPYFLRLTFPGNIVEDDRAKATYDVGKGQMTVVLAKEEPGQFFPDLDMLTKLLVRKGDLSEKSKADQIKRPLIEVMSKGDTLEGTHLEKDEDFDWQLPQQINQEIFSEVRYGFNNRYSGFFTHVTETANDVLDVYDPEHATLEVRRENRIQRENDKFDDEYYMSDFMIEEEIQHILKYKTPWWNELRAVQKAEKDSKQSGKAPSKDSPALATKPKAPVSIPSAASSSTTFKSSLLSNQSQPSTPSIFNIVKDDGSDDESSRHQALDTIGLREVSTKSIPKIAEVETSSTLLESISAKKPLIAPMEPGMMQEEEEPLIRPSGLANVTVIDPSRPSLNSNLVTDMADMNLGEASPAQKPFSAKEQEIMRDLPKREYILENAKSTYLGLIDILFAYSYDLRVTEGDANIETAWTICKLSATMAALDQFTTLRETLLASFRRALAYPLNRNWTLANKVLQDVYVILKLGKRGILRALLAIKDVLDHDDIYYIYSKMFVEDYCVWIQSASDKVIRTLAHELHHFELQKSEIGWHLDELEQLAKEIPEEEEEEEESSEEEDSSENDSDDDDSSDDEEDSDDDDEDSNEQDTKSSQKDSDNVSLAPEEEESIFMHEGPRPKIVML